MYKEIPKLIMYRDLGEDSIILSLAQIIKEFESGQYDKTDLISRIYGEVHKLLEVGTTYGFDKNLWHDYIAYVLATNENPFSLTTEGIGANSGSVNQIVLRDMKVFNRLFNYNFNRIERILGIDCFSIITNYSSVHKRRQLYNRDVSAKIRKLSDAISDSMAKNRYDVAQGKIHADEAEDVNATRTLQLITDFYKDNGVGMFGLNSAFRTEEEGGLHFTPINNYDRVMLDDLVGYDIQKNRLRENTENFLKGNAANNVLLFGDAGTGKSTSIKALINEYQSQGLRMIELYKHQMRHLSTIISIVKNRNYRFIIYMDDLSFEENETEYKYLKAVIEGGLETRPDNVLIYATSNRRNLIRETWNDINDIEMDKHRSDTLQEKLSLVSRFGVTIPYIRPNKREYEEIVRELAKRTGRVDLTEEELMTAANKWSVSHGGMSGRAAQQLIDSLG